MGARRLPDGSCHLVFRIHVFSDLEIVFSWCSTFIIWQARCFQFDTRGMPHLRVFVAPTDQVSFVFVWACFEPEHFLLVCCVEITMLGAPKTRLSEILFC